MSFTREQYEEVFKNAAALYKLIRDDVSGAHRHKMRGKALAVFIMDQCEQVLGQRSDRPDLRPDMKNGGRVHVALEMSQKELADRLSRSGFKVSRR